MRAVRTLVVWLAGVALVGCGGPGNPNGPTISSFSPMSGTVGTQVQIQGTHFATPASGNTVRFNGVAAAVLDVTATTLTVQVPDSATTGHIQVMTSVGTAETSQNFTVSPSTPGSNFTVRLSPPGASTVGLAFSGSRFVSVGTDNTQTSIDGLVWSSATGSTQQDVAFNGTKFVAVGDFGSIETSANGLSWSHAFAGSSDLRAVASSGAVWVAVGQSGAIYSSPDGSTWTSRGSSGLTTQNLNAVAWTGSQFVAVGTAGTVLTSADGSSWTPRTAPSSADISAVAGSASTVVVSSGKALYSSPDANSWTPRGTYGGSFNRIIYANGQFTAVGFYVAATSPDGAAWTQNTTLLGVLDSVVFASGQYWALGSNLNMAGTVFSSANGKDWSVRAVAQNLTSLARSPVDGRVVAVGGTHASQSSMDGIGWEFGVSSNDINQNYQFVGVAYAPSAGGFVALVQVGANQYGYKSTDGKSWTSLAYAPCYGAIAASNTVMVNVGTSLSGACLASSVDGSSWTTQTVPSGQMLRQAFWVGSQFVAVGDSGALATSPDGVTWTPRTTGTSSGLTGVAGSSSMLVAVGGSGTLLSSPDGVTWTQRTSGTPYSISRVIWTGAEFYAVGGAGLLLRSTDGVTWASKTNPFSASLTDVVWLGDLNRLVMVGGGGFTGTSP